MGFGVRIAPGVRIRASRRGVRVGLGPRAARVHSGSGRPGVSTGVGPVTVWHTLGSSTRRRSHRPPARHVQVGDNGACYLRPAAAGEVVTKDATGTSAAEMAASSESELVQEFESGCPAEVSPPARGAARVARGAARLSCGDARGTVGKRPVAVRAGHGGCTSGSRTPSTQRLAAVDVTLGPFVLVSQHFREVAAAFTCRVLH